MAIALECAHASEVLLVAFALSLSWMTSTRFTALMRSLAGDVSCFSQCSLQMHTTRDVYARFAGQPPHNECKPRARLVGSRRGRFSVVRGALHRKEKSKYAVKVVENKSLSDEENLEALETEVCTYCSLMRDANARVRCRS